jgi:PAS domain S-box-containing protein
MNEIPLFIDKNRISESKSREGGSFFQKLNRPRQQQLDLLFEIAGGIAASGSDFFYSLIESLARYVNVDRAWVAENISSSRPALRTLAVYIDGQEAENFEYSILDTAAQNAFNNPGIYLCPADVQHRFPGDSILRCCDASGYAAISLVGSGGEVLGLLAIASRHSLGNTRLLATLLRIFATRAVGELQKRKADHALRASEARLKLIFDHAPEAYLLLTPDGKVLEANQSAERLTGYTRAEMVGRDAPMAGILPEEDIRGEVSRLPAAGGFTIRHRNGRRVTAEIQSQIVPVNGTQVILLCARDVASLNTVH